MPAVQINLWGVIAATAFGMVVGAIWYSELLFGKQWMKLAGKKASDLQNNAGSSYLLTGLLWLLIGYVLAHFVQYTFADTWLEGAITGFWLWTGFVFAPQLIHALFDGTSKKLLAINASYTLLALLGMGIILVILPN